MSVRSSNNRVDDEMETLSESPPKQLGDAEPAQQEEQSLLPEHAQDHRPPCFHPIDDNSATSDPAKLEKSDLRPHLRIITKGVRSPTASSASATLSKDEDTARHPGFGVEPGTLELVRVARKEWAQPQNLPLPITASSKYAPIISEFTRPWSALRLKPQPLESLPRARVAELPQDQSLLKNYEPRFSIGEHTFPASEITTPSLLDARVAVEDALALLVTMNLRLALGSVRACRAKRCRRSLAFRYLLTTSVLCVLLADRAALLSARDLRRVAWLPSDGRVQLLTTRRNGPEWRHCQPRVLAVQVPACSLLRAPEPPPAASLPRSQGRKSARR